MTIARSLLCAVAFAALISGAQAQEKAPAGKDLEGWGEVVDPKGDCQVTLKGGRLTIVVPETLHDLAAEYGQADAPRVLREVEGDFVAEVKSVGDLTHFGKTTSTRYVAYHGAGLVLWIDGKNYARLERAAIARDGVPIHYADFAIRKEAKVDGTPNRMPSGPMNLRLERKGNTLSATARSEGQEPVAFKREFQFETMPRTVRVGVVAVNTSDVPLVAEFESLSIQPVQPETPKKP